jgi:ribosomal protein L29
MGNSNSKETYDRDFVAWSDEQAMLLEQKRWNELDLWHLIEEVKDLGNRHRDALESQLTRLLMHLLKWRYQEQNQSPSWASTIKEARKQIERLIRKHPVLRVHLERVFLECYLDAREDAADETGLSISTFPLECPFDLQSVLDKDWFPT